MRGHELPLIRLSPPDRERMFSTPVVLMHDAHGEGADFIQPDGWALGLVRAGFEVWLGHQS